MRISARWVSSTTVMMMIRASQLYYLLTMLEDAFNQEEALVGAFPMIVITDRHDIAETAFAARSYSRIS